MPTGPKKTVWERTNVSNLLRNGESGVYYGRVKRNGRQIWRSLDTTVASVAKLRLSDFVRQVSTRESFRRSSAMADETSVARFICMYRQETASDPSLSAATKYRRETAVKALLKTWPDLPSRDARRVTPTHANEWARVALNEGTGFVAPNARTTRRGMSASSFNKCLEALRAVFVIAIKHGAAYVNPADAVNRAKLRSKKIELPTVDQFLDLVDTISRAGARQSQDCAELVRFLAFSGMRLGEATAIRWRHVNVSRSTIAVPGTKSDASDREIPIFPPLGTLLARMRDRRGTTHPDDPILRVGECRGALRAACAKLGLAKLTHHDLRHLFATRCVESGVDIPTVSRWLGHADGGALAMRVYGHLRQEHSAAEALKVNFGPAD